MTKEEIPAMEVIKAFKRIEPEETVLVQVNRTEWIEVPKQYCQD